MSSDRRELKIIYVGGYSRSGSTLFARVLGEAPGAVCVGETRYLWSRGLIDNVQCGCGQPFRSCSFWSAVGEEAFGGWGFLDAERLAAIDHATNMLGALPLYLVPRLRPGFATTIDRYVEVLGRLYDAIAAISGARTIIETSKAPTFACLLMRVPHAEVRVIHLVRDSRAVAHSWMRRRRLSSPIGGNGFMPQFHPASTALRWLSWNAAFDVISLGHRRFRRLTYESFVADPRGVLSELEAFVGEPLLLDEAQLSDDAVTLGSHHIFSGNPMRESSGRLSIRLDSEWRSELSAVEQAQVGAITWPLLLRYRYPIAPGRGASGSQPPIEGAAGD